MIWNKRAEIKIDFRLIDCNSPEWDCSWIPSAQKAIPTAATTPCQTIGQFMKASPGSLVKWIIWLSCRPFLFIIIYEHQRVSWSKCRLCWAQFIMLAVAAQETMHLSRWSLKSHLKNLFIMKKRIKI